MARVAGTQDQPYQVKLEFGDGQSAATCSCPFDREPVCKHAVAACMALSAPAAATYPSQSAGAAIEKAQNCENDLRRASAKSERFRIVARPGRNRPSFALRSERTQATYEVFVSAQVSFCACADFLPSELGTCKHLLHLSRETEAKRPLAHPVVFLQAADTRGIVHEPLRDIRAI